VVDAPLQPLPADEPRGAHPLLGFGLVWSAVALWAVNATVSKVVLESAGLSAMRLAEVRATGAAVILMAAVAIVRPGSLRVRSWRELAFLAVFGVAGLAFVQLFYFLAIERLDIGIALVIQYLAPVFVALWARFVVKEPVRRRLWLAIALALAGLALVVDLPGGMTLDSAGVAACLITAVAYAAYILMAERALRDGRDQFSLLAWGFLFSALFWAAVQPWWTFPWDDVDGSVSLLGRLADVDAHVWLLLGYLVVLGTIVPFLLMVTALHSIPATRVTVIAMLEPALAALVAYAWLEEELTGLQVAGCLLVLVGVGIAQTARATRERSESDQLRS
jgi:drug/metabolite transporter (DMT)-like permease